MVTTKFKHAEREPGLGGKPRALTEFLTSSCPKSSPVKAAPFPRSFIWRSAKSRWPAAPRSPLATRETTLLARSKSNNDCHFEERVSRTAPSKPSKRSQQEEPDDEESEDQDQDESVHEWDEAESKLAFSEPVMTVSTGQIKEQLLRVADSPELSCFPDEVSAKQASLNEELAAFRGNPDLSITMFPDYFSSDEKLLVQQIAKGLELGCQVGEKTVAVYKMQQSTGIPLPHVMARLLSSTLQPNASMPCGERDNNTSSFDEVFPTGHAVAADDVYVDLSALAQQGKDNFISRVRLRRLNSGSGMRRNMLWDVAQLSSSSDVVTDRVTDGQGGVYAVQSRTSGQKLAMFKPVEEEKFTRDGLSRGEGAVREEAAYVLDSQANGFSGVPPTAVARLKLSALDGTTKQGSVQRFMASSIGSMESFGMPFDLERAQQFVPVEQVHRIAILDVRVFNTDRHHGNILLIGDRAPYTMVPIDHGCILPSWFHLSEARFDWLEYPQSRVPFSPLELAHIEELDADRDAVALRALGIREECIVTMKMCTMLLKLAARHSRSLHWIGSFMQREGCFEDASAFEHVVVRACNAVGVMITLKRNEWGEEKSCIELGVLSRRPPAQFFRELERILLEEITTAE